jgi:hypothetical protein
MDGRYVKKKGGGCLLFNEKNACLCLITFSILPALQDYGSFCAFDVALPGTSRFSIDVLQANTET